MRKLLLLGAALALVPAAILADENAYKLTVEDKAVPEAIDAEVRDQIEPKAYILADAEGAFFEFWFAKHIELKKKTDSSDEALKAIPEVSLLGAMVVHRDNHEDFREDYIDPGTYVLRLGMQPQDGNHMGTSPTDTFAVLVPAARDAEVRDYPMHDEMVDIALEDTATAHPPILSLQPVSDTEGEFPRLGVGENDWQMLVLKLPAKAGEETLDIHLQMVFEGIGYL